MAQLASCLRILDIHDFISDMVLLHTKNKAVSLKGANSVVHVYKDEGMSSPFMPKKVQSNGVHLMQMSFLGEKHVFSKFHFQLGAWCPLKATKY